jgi:hypothetical protein
MLERASNLLLLHGLLSGRALVHLGSLDELDGLCARALVVQCPQIFRPSLLFHSNSGPTSSKFMSSLCHVVLPNLQRKTGTQVLGSPMFLWFLHTTQGKIWFMRAERSSSLLIDFMQPVWQIVHLPSIAIRSTYTTNFGRGGRDDCFLAKLLIFIHILLGQTIQVIM